MVTVNANLDGFQYQAFDTAVGVQEPTSAGIYLPFYNTGNNLKTYDASGNFSDIGTRQEIAVGYDRPLDGVSTETNLNTASFTFQSLAIDQGSAIGSASLVFPTVNNVDNCIFTLSAILAADASLPSNTSLPTDQPKTIATQSYSAAADANYPDTETSTIWTQSVTDITLDVTAIMQECVNHASWSNPSKITFVLTANQYDATNTDLALRNTGKVYIWSVDHPTETPTQLTYTVLPAPTISDVGTDDAIRSDETNVIINGTNLSNINEVLISKDGIDYNQLVTSADSTQVEFNMAGNVPVGSGYTLTAKNGQSIATLPIIIESAEVTELDTFSDTVLTSVDGHEYANSGTGFPGTWETQSSLTSTVAWEEGLLVGEWNGNYFKASMSLGPINVPQGAALQRADLNLNVLTNYKYNSFKIKAVADPAAAAIGASNIISSQSLTTAEIETTNAVWTGADATTRWTQEVNPRPLSILSVAQEVIDHANWSSGSYLQVVIDFDTVVYAGGQQGYTRLFSNDNTNGLASTFSYVQNTGVTIISVSGNDVIELGETGCTIVGYNIGSASNLSIDKGAISESQTILSNTDTNIVFDVNTGAIVAGTGYTLSFDVDGTTYSTTVSFVEGGGVNAGSEGSAADGHEYGATLPALGNPGTWQEEYAAFNAVWIGLPILGGGNEYIATMRIGPITAQEGQSFPTADLTWAVGSNPNGFGYKGVVFDIYGVANPTVSELGSSNLPSAQTLTTAKVTVDTSTWAGHNATDYWVPSAEVIDISTVVEEIVSSNLWVTGSYLQLVLIPASYPSGGGFVGFGSVEGGTSPLFDYVTGAATNIANINGNNIIKTGDTGVILSGSDLASITSIAITDGAYTETQTVLTNTSTEITFDFVRGSLKHGAATLSLVKDSRTYTFDVTLTPVSGRDYVVLETPGIGDNSLTYNDDPALLSVDQIEFEIVSGNGFDADVNNTGVPTIYGGSGVDTMVVAGYLSSTGVWYDDQTITFNSSDYLIQNKLPLTEFLTSSGIAAVDIDGGDVTNPDEPEEPVGEVDVETTLEQWVVQQDNDDDEVWQ